MRRSLEPVFSQKFNGNQEQFEQLMKNQIAILQKNTFSLIDNSASKKHATIDTLDNYKKESELCSEIEHDSLSRVILRM